MNRARVAFALSLCLATPAMAGTVELISRANPPAAPAVTGRAFDPAISENGRYVAFLSNSPNLAAGQVDANNGDDVFLRDRQTGTVTLVSHASGSPTVTASASSSAPSISADGRWVAFQSSASNLVAGQSGPTFTPNIYVFDRTTGTVTLVSHAHGQAAKGGSSSSVSPQISADGSTVLFRSVANDLVSGFTATTAGYALYRYDRAAGTNTLVDHVPGSPTTTANDQVTSYALSGDGRYVAYSSRATDLVTGVTDANDGSTLGEDAFLFDATTGTSVLISHAAGSTTTTAGDVTYIDIGSVSGDGRYVVLRSEAADLAAGQVDSNGASDVFLWDRDTGASTLVSHTAASNVTAAGSYGGRVSADGGWVAFGSAGLDVVAGQVNPNGATGNLFLWQRATNSSVLVSHAAGSNVTSGNGAAIDPDVSSDGAYVAFIGTATDHIAGGTDTNFEGDVFLWTRAGGAIALASRTAGSATTTGDSFSLVLELSGDGGSLAFASSSSDLVVPDGNTGTGDSGFLPGSDVFVFDRAAGTNTAASFSPAAASDAAGGASSIPPLPSRDGRYVLFQSRAANLAPGVVKANAADDADVYLRDRLTGTTTLVSHRYGSATTTGDDDSEVAALSDDGNWALFLSSAGDLISPPLPNPFIELYLYSRQTGTVTYIDRSLRGSLSADGRYIAYTTFTNAYVYDRETGTRTLVSHTAASPTQGAGVDINGSITISGDGRYVLYASSSTAIVAGQSDTNGAFDVFLYDRLSGTNVLVSRAPSSATTTGNAASRHQGFGLSEDGRYALFFSDATNLIAGQTDTAGTQNLFLFDRVAGTVTLVDHAAGAAATAGAFTSFGALSRDGRYVAFHSLTTNLVAGQVDTNNSTDVFLWDRATDATLLVTHLAGAPLTAATGSSGAGLFSADGTALTFSSFAPDLLAGQSDANGAMDVFLYDRLSGKTRLVTRSTASPLATAHGSHGFGRPDGTGDLVVFASSAPDLVAGNDVNQEHDVFAFTNGRDYFTVAPCRLLDTRQPADGPALVSGVTETLTVPGRCGIPASARALAVNVTVTQPSAGGHLTFGPGGAALPLASTINFGAGQTRANNAILPLDAAAGGTLAVQASVPGGGTVHVILDVVGYFE